MHLRPTGPAVGRSNGSGSDSWQVPGFGLSRNDHADTTYRRSGSDLRGAARHCRACFGCRGWRRRRRSTLNPVNADGYNFRGDLTIWTAVVFLLVLAILYKAAWGPISEGLQKRESEIAGQIAEAQRKNEEARQLLADYEKKLAAAQEEVRSLIEQGRRDAEKVGQQLLEKAREEAGIERQRAVQQIESATLAALKELADRSATLAVDLAGKIVGAQLKAADHSRLIEQAVTEFTRIRPGKVNGKSHAIGGGVPWPNRRHYCPRCPQRGPALARRTREKVCEVYALALLGAVEHAGQTLAVLDESMPS